MGVELMHVFLCVHVFKPVLTHAQIKLRLSVPPVCGLDILTQLFSPVLSLLSIESLFLLIFPSETYQIGTCQPECRTAGRGAAYSDTKYGISP
jgi:hypothetical protein